MLGHRSIIRANNRPPNLPKYRAALAAMGNNVRNARVMCLGDSFTEGVYSDATDIYSNAWPNQLAILLRGNGVNANCNSAFGFQQALFSGGTNNSDPRSIPGGNAATVTGTVVQSIGGPMMQFPGSTSTFTINLASASVDTIKPYYGTTPAAASFQWRIDGGGYTTINSGGTPDPRTQGSFTINTTLGGHTVNLVWVSGYVNIAGWEAYDSTHKEVQLMNCGWSGAKTSDWTLSTYLYSPGNAIANLAPDLVIIELGLNDLNASTGISVAAYQANLQTLVNSAKAAGADVLLVTGGPYDPVQSSVSYATQQLYWSAMRTVAIQNNIPMVDMTIHWVDWATATARGFEATGTYPAPVHPSKLGQQDYAAAIFNAIGRL